MATDQGSRRGRLARRLRGGSGTPPRRRVVRRVAFALFVVGLGGWWGWTHRRKETIEEWWGLPTLPAAAVEPAVEVRGPVTFAKDVAPILWAKCAGCHRPGEVGPFSLLSYRDAARRAEFLREVTESGRMPPWKPEPGFGTFEDDDRLTPRERAILARWADDGAPEGDPADLPGRPQFPDGWRLGTPDLVVELPKPFLVHADGDDLYRAFVLPLPAGGDREVVAFEFRPGNRRVVHHSKLFLDPTDASRRRDADDPGPGFASVGAADLGQPAIFEWTPGTVPKPFPTGVGQILPAGADLVLFVHYHPDGRPEADRSRVGIYLAKTPLTRHLAGIPLGTSKIDIPAGASHHEVTASTTLPAPVRVFGLLPHGHFLLRDIRLRAVLPDGNIERLLWIRDWDFDWQGQYRLASPLLLPAGTRLDLVGTYDNSAANPRNPTTPPRRVRFGPSSTDEMLGCHLQVIPDSPDGAEALRGKYKFGL
ncbi:MAG TPA: ascorbate-dependent monooxygenase [Isosphaeraceae bacterium]|nr:ascorbate-dependent monooxygenase [Isosphaeraceae bacterium]